MRKTIVTSLVALLLCVSTSAIAGHAFINFDDDGNMILSGPFNVVVPKPNKALGQHGPVNSTPSFLYEDLKVSMAAYYAANQLVVVKVEKTSAGAGRLTNVHLPVMELAGEEFRAREGCLDISQEELDADDDPLLEFIEEMNVQLAPAVQAMQLFVINDDGTAEGVVLFLRNVPGGCADMSDDFRAKFKGDFEKFVASVRAAN